MDNFIEEIDLQEFEVENAGVPAGTVGQRYGEFRKSNHVAPERLLFGASRGQVIASVAGTNLGKTTFALNAALTLASGREWLPMLPNLGEPLRVLYIDGERTKAELHADIDVMLNSLHGVERELVLENLYVVCDEFLSGEPLVLSDETHLETIKQTLLRFGADVVVVDTMSALFRLGNENDNSEVTNRVMHPLKALASQTNTLIWMMHHSGKMSEGSARGAYAGRGASTLGSLARSVTCLTQPDKADPFRVVFSVEKSKGFRLKNVVLRLDNDARWFRPTGETPPERSNCINAVLKAVDRQMTTNEIVDALPDYKRRSVEEALTKAVADGRLMRPRQGTYSPAIVGKSADPV